MISLLKNPYVIATLAVVAVISLLLLYHFDQVNYLKERLGNSLELRKQEKAANQLLIDSLYYALISVKKDTVVVRDTTYLVRPGYYATPFTYEDTFLWLRAIGYAPTPIDSMQFEHRIKAYNISPPPFVELNTLPEYKGINLNMPSLSAASRWKAYALWFAAGAGSATLTYILIK